MQEIEKIVAFYNTLANEESALGTVVNVSGSSYRRIGARMLVSADGRWVGGISGGCLEGDALRQAQKAISLGKPTKIIYDTTQDDLHQIGIGLGCRGKIEVLIKPLQPKQDDSISYLQKLIGSRKPNILLHIISADKKYENFLGQTFDAISSSDVAQLLGVLPNIILNKIEETYRTKTSSVEKLNNDSQQEFEILVEYIEPKIRVICAGHNYDIDAMIDLGNTIGFQMELICQANKISKTTFQKAAQVYDYSASEFLIDEHTAIVLMTHDYKKDYELLKKVLDKNIRYIGILGPKARTARMQQDLKQEGHDFSLLENETIFSPMGLDIGATTAEEIALSTLAEITTVFRNRDGHFLKLRKGTIHDD